MFNPSLNPNNQNRAGRLERIPSRKQIGKDREHIENKPVSGLPSWLSILPGNFVRFVVPRTQKAASMPPHSISSRAFAPLSQKTFVNFVVFVVINSTRKLCALRGFPHTKSGVDAAALHIVPGFCSPLT
jgi:hypothetical protein